MCAQEVICTLGLVVAVREGKRGSEKSASGEGDMASRQMGQSVGEWVIGGVKVVRCWVRK